MVHELIESIDFLQSSSTHSVAIFASKVDGCFCAGADLKVATSITLYVNNIFRNGQQCQMKKQKAS